LIFSMLRISWAIGVPCAHTTTVSTPAVRFDDQTDGLRGHLGFGPNALGEGHLESETSRNRQRACFFGEPARGAIHHVHAGLLEFACEDH
jgi:hypothetical protein